jgi:hypothetical protein
MKPSIWLRVAAILTLIHAVLHTVGGMFGSPRNTLQAAARSVVQSLHFDAFGSNRSYWDFYFGFGLATSVTLFLLTALLWQLASLVKTDPSKARPFLAMLFITFIALAVISWIYFFAPPFVFEIVIAVCIGAAFVLAGKRNPA